MITIHVISRTLALVLSVFLLSCNDVSPNPYRISGSIKVDDRNRIYELNLPPSYYEGSSFPLVIALHGAGGSALQCERDYGLTEKAEATNFMVVYPEGIASIGPLGLQAWNAGSCCGYAQERGVDDVKFISRLIDKLTQDFKVDPKRVYVTGMSNGAMMAYRLACEISDKIAAIAPVSGTLLTETSCNPSNPLPILHIHSELDEKVPYLGGTGLANYYFPPVDSGLQVWVMQDHCLESSPKTEDHTTYIHSQWTECDNEVVIERYITKDGGHAWPGGKKSRSGADTPSTAFNATDLIWEFFSRY